jgi:hypothetical protein
LPVKIEMAQLTIAVTRISSDQRKNQMISGIASSRRKMTVRRLRT